MPTSQNSKSKDDPLCPPSEQSERAAESAELAELNDLARFEGEGGPEEPVPGTELIEVRLENAVWRRSPERQIKRIE